MLSVGSAIRLSSGVRFRKQVMWTYLGMFKGTLVDDATSRSKVLGKFQAMYLARLSMVCGFYDNPVSTNCIRFLFLHESDRATY